MNPEKSCSQFMPWLGSLVTHLAVLIAFALWWLPTSPGPVGPIVLEASVSDSYDVQAEDLIELESLDIEFEAEAEASLLETLEEVPIEVPPPYTYADEPAPPPRQQEGPAEGTARGIDEGESEADEIARRVAAAGGEEGELQMSLAWEGMSDLDIHVVTPMRERISFQNKKAVRSGGVLDVDMNAKTWLAVTSAVENVRFGGSPPEGKYRVVVHLYKLRGGDRRTKIPFLLRVKRGGDVIVRRGYVSLKKQTWSKTFGYRGNPERRVSMFDTEQPLWQLAENDFWTIGDSFTGIFCVGQTGSGKSSGSVQSAFKAMAAAGYGGLVHTAKPGDRQEFQKWAKEVGREDSVIVFDLHGPWKFNFIDYEARCSAANGGFSALNIVQVLKSLAKNIGRNESGGAGGDDSTFWLEQFARTVMKAANLLMAATGGLTLEGVRDLIRSAPSSPEELDDEVWEASSLCSQMVEETFARLENLDSRVKRDFLEAASFFYKEYPRLAEKTRSIIVAKVNAVLELFLEGPLHERFCTTTNVVPDVALNGAIIILDAPIRQHKELGHALQLSWKYAFQRAAERSGDRAKRDAVPAFLIADEAQLIATEEDMSFLTTARSSKVATLFATQNISNFYAVLGGESKRATVDSLLGNLATKVFHAQSDNTTNQWAADLIGKEWQHRMTTSEGESNMPMMPGYIPKSKNENVSFSEQLEHAILPSEFTTLRTGGEKNDCHVDAIVHQAGRVWNHTDKTTIRATFDQNL